MAEAETESAVGEAIAIDFAPEYEPTPEFLAVHGGEQEAGPEDPATDDAAGYDTEAEAVAHLSEHFGFDATPYFEQANELISDIDALPDDVMDALVDAPEVAPLADMVMWLSELQSMRDTPVVAEPVSAEVMGEIQSNWPRETVDLLRRAWGVDFERRLSWAGAAYEARAVPDSVLKAIVAAGPRALAEGVALASAIGERLTGR